MYKKLTIWIIAITIFLGIGIVSAVTVIRTGEGRLWTIDSTNEPMNIRKNPQVYADHQWTFNTADVSGTTINDVRGSWNGTSSNTPSLSAGTFGQQMDFDGATDKVTQSDNWGLTQSLTIITKAGITTESSGENHNMILSSSDPATYISFAVNGNRQAFASVNTADNPARLLNSGNTINVDTQYCLAVTYDGQVATLYLDGKPVESLPATGNIEGFTTGNKVMGSYRASDTMWLPGWIDDIQIYDEVLTVEQINNNCLTNSI